MMRSWFLLGILALQVWAEACSPVPEPSEVSRARSALARAQDKALSQKACLKSQSDECTAYNASPEQVVKWLRHLYGEPVKRGNGWQIVGEAKHGRTTTVEGIRGGTLVTTMDRLTAWEKVEKRLSAVRKTHLPFQTCNSLGLSDSAYSISDCQWRGQDMTFKITAATDKSLPAGLYEWLEMGTCGYSLQGPKK
ncbi:hypothetical protein ACINK0_13490 [Deinococcus sp. VB343]|uniref:hypothetical protein n=1 Tax=Deinococcus sp. VB343 TaxID=3385567 RepID=UPI0039C95917